MIAAEYAAIERRRRRAIVASRFILAIVLIGLWEFGAGRWFDPIYFSSPTRVAKHLIEWFGGDILRHAGITIRETLSGYVAGAAVGVATGILLSRLRFLGAVLDPFIVALNGTPRIALAPILIIWFGIGETSKIVLAGLLTFFLCFYSTLAGIRMVDPAHISLARVLGASERQILWRVVLPSTAPWILNALKVSLPFALIGAIVGEFLASTAGLGHMIRLYTSQFDTTGALAGITILMLFVVLINLVVEGVERRLLRWRPAAARTASREVQ